MIVDRQTLPRVHAAGKQQVVSSRRVTMLFRLPGCYPARRFSCATAYGRFQDEGKMAVVSNKKGRV